MRTKLGLVLSLAVLASCCDEDREIEHLNSESQKQEQHIATLATENAVLLETQSKSFAEQQIGLPSRGVVALRNSAALSS